MIFNMYTIFDRVSGTYGDPFLCLTDEVAKRKFNYTMSKAPMVSADCQLYKLAEFDNVSGDLVVPVKPEFICSYEEA